MNGPKEKKSLFHSVSPLKVIFSSLKGLQLTVFIIKLRLVFFTVLTLSVLSSQYITND